MEFNLKVKFSRSIWANSLLRFGYLGFLSWIEGTICALSKPRTGLFGTHGINSLKLSVYFHLPLFTTRSPSLPHENLCKFLFSDKVCLTTKKWLQHAISTISLPMALYSPCRFIIFPWLKNLREKVQRTKRIFDLSSKKF